MTLFKAFRDSSGFHYLVQIDDMKPPSGTNLQRFDWPPVPASGFTQAQWVALHRREMKAWVQANAAAVALTPTTLPDEGQTL